MSDGSQEFKAAQQAEDISGRQTALRRWRLPLLVGGPVLIVAAAGAYLAATNHIQSTDNAYVQVAKAPVSASVGGRVVEVFVHENQHVAAGTPLFRLESQDYAVETEQARAQLAQAKLQVRALRAAYQRAQSSVGAARQTLAFAQTEASRQRKLLAAGVVSQQQVDQAQHALDTARSALSTAEAEAASALANIDGDLRTPIEQQPSVLAAAARLKRAEINQSYTVVAAPADGVVTRVQQLQIGGYVNASQTVFWLLSGEPWVEASFKESQLARMRIGQPVDIRIDAYPDKVFKGRVASFSPGTGSTFSALPAQNATGNWVKVTQRLPVEIAFDEPPGEMAGRAGLSAQVKVDVAETSRAAPPGGATAPAASTAPRPALRGPIVDDLK